MHNIKPNCDLCRSCYYFRRQNDNNGCCDYIGIELHSRIFDDNGKRKLTSNECDKYKPSKVVIVDEK